MFAAGGFALSLAKTFGLLGPVSEWTMLLLGVATITAIVGGVRRFRPDVTWPWVMIATAMALFLLGGAFRVMHGTVGDLTASRPVVADGITLSGYLVLVVGVLGMIRQRDRSSSHVLDALVDALILATCALLAGWTLVVEPALAGAEVAMQVHVILIAYPTSSVLLATVAVRLVAADARQRVAASLLAGSALVLLAGDVLYRAAELDPALVSQQVIDLPYALSFVMGGSAALHPSMRTLSEVTDSPYRPASAARLSAVVLSLPAPAVLATLYDVQATADRAVLLAGTFVLTCAVAVRLWRAVTASGRDRARLAHKAAHDDLTDLPNRTHLEAELDRALDRADRPDAAVAVLFLDLDRFKLVNDSLGHSTGDRLLREVADRLSAVLGPTVLLSRVGGDEFVVVLEGVTADKALAVAERIRASFACPFEVGGAQLHTGVSVGVALSTDEITTPDQLLSSADSAMYRAKDGGRNRICLFDRSMVEQVSRQLELDALLRGAQERDELSVVYQPIVALDTGTVSRSEALLRWYSPQLGQVSPAEFIPLAEETGLVVELGSFVIEQVCSDLAAARKAGSDLGDLPVSVNLSARQLILPGLVDTVRTTIGRFGLPSELLSFEVTETALIDDPGQTAATLRGLRQLGCSISLDDFGTGYSSLAYLQRYEVDVVKVDRAFVIGLGQQESSSSLVAAIVAMGGALGTTTLAEGVETDLQRRVVTDLGCSEAQGFLFARPGSYLELERYLGPQEAWEVTAAA